MSLSGASHSEYSLLLNLNKVAEVQSLVIGFNSVWTDSNEKI